MAQPTPATRTQRPALRDPEWWTAVAADLLDVKFGSLAKDVAKLLKKDQQDVAYGLSSLYQDTFNTCLEDNNYDFTLEISKEVAAAFDMATFDPRFPTAHPLFVQLLDQARHRLIKARGREDVTYELDEQVRQTFGGTFTLVRTMDSTKYRGAQQYIELLLKGYETPEGQAIAHTNTILHALAHDPLPIDAAVTLWQIYITPRARYREPQTSTTAREQPAREVDNLIASLLKTLGNSTAPIILHGQPGHGKSSTVRMLTHALVTQARRARRPPPLILFYEFKDLGRLDRHELQILAERTSFLQGESFFHRKRTVLILDGMDERQITDGSDVPLKDFIRHLFTLVERINQRSDASQLHLIFTGRTQFVRQVQSAFTAGYHLYEILDFTPAQVATWLDKYCVLKQVHPPLTVDDLKAKHLGDLMSQPILLTMTAQMLVDVQGRQLLSVLPAGQVSRGAIYRTIITWTYRKRWQAHPNRAALPNEEIYTRFLRALAMTLFRQGQESVKIGELTAALQQQQELYGLEDFRHKTPKEVEDICQHIAVSFFFKGLEANVLSFIHKTIKDYLTVEAWVALLRDITANFNARQPERSSEAMARDLYFLFGGQTFVPDDHRGFLDDILLMAKDDARRLFEPLAVFFKAVQRHTYLGEYGGKLSTDPIQTEAYLCAMLLQLLTGIVRVCSDEERHALASGSALQLFEEPDGLYKCLHLLNATGIDHWAMQIFDLSYLDLHDAKLSGANLSGANLSGADLSGADLGNADLRDATLAGAFLRDAFLAYANLSDAFLAYADLKDADLAYADLRNADLSNADLSGAILSGADLRGAILSDADLSDADLSDADLRGADLSNADLSNAKLTANQLEQLISLQGAIMPDGLKYQE